MVGTKKIWVKQIRVLSNEIRYIVLKTLNISPTKHTQIGHVLEKWELENYNDRWEVEIT